MMTATFPGAQRVDGDVEPAGCLPGAESTTAARPLERRPAGLTPRMGRAWNTPHHQLHRDGAVRDLRCEPLNAFALCSVSYRAAAVRDDAPLLPAEAADVTLLDPGCAGRRLRVEVRSLRILSLPVFSLIDLHVHELKVLI